MVGPSEQIPEGINVRNILSAIALVCMAVSGVADAKGKGSHSTSTHSTSVARSHSTSAPTISTGRAASSPKNATSHPRQNKTQGVRRNSKGRIARDPKQKAAFEKTHPCPSTGKSHGACPGYVVDHIRPLKRGGADRSENMQWQTKEAARRKDRTE